VFDPGLHIRDSFPGIAFEPLAIEILRHQAELDDEIGRQVLRPYLAALLLPEADQGFFVLAHDNPGI